MGKNILVTTLSISQGGQPNIYFMKEGDGQAKKYCLGMLSMEPGSRYILSKYHIDKIVAIATNETLEADHNGKTWRDKYEESIVRFSDDSKVEDSFENFLSDLEKKGENIIADLNKLKEIKLSETNQVSDNAEKRNYELEKMNINNYETLDMLLLKPDIETQSKVEEKDLLAVLDILKDETEQSKNKVKVLKEKHPEINAQEKQELLSEEKNIKDNQRLISFLLPLDKKRKLKDICSDKKDNLMFFNEENKKLVNNQKLIITFVDEEKNGEYNIKEIVESIYEDKEDVNLFIDVQGGNRTSGYVRNAALSILCNQYPEQIQIKK